ncbi:MAG TPA: T9SS type A sorting domain-containing protein, partial [Catalimonadaceae bacterium]|nr:T9SS type A sorting domain-containing protein [Catalimonadaceae bacterium]
NNGKFVANFFSKSSGLAQIKLVNSIGQVMANYSTMVPSGDVKLPFDMSALSDGIYFMNISINGQAASQRIVKN